MADGRGSAPARAAIMIAGLGALALAASGTFGPRATQLVHVSAIGLDSLPPGLARMAAPALAQWIRSSRKTALAAGTVPIPDAVRASLAGYVPDDVLETVRWCRGCGDALSLQRTALELYGMPAVTLDDVVVFGPPDIADVEDPALWAHELRHVMQYEDWGVEAFAVRYLADYEAVEHEAAEFRWQWMKRTHDPRTVAPARRSPPSSGSGD